MFHLITKALNGFSFFKDIKEFGNVLESVWRLMSDANGRNSREGSNGQPSTGSDTTEGVAQDTIKDTFNAVKIGLRWLRLRKLLVFLEKFETTMMWIDKHLPMMHSITERVVAIAALVREAVMGWGSMKNNNKNCKPEGAASAQRDAENAEGDDHALWENATVGGDC